MLIGGDDISYDYCSIFHMFFNVCLHSCSFLLRADWRKSDSSYVDREPLGNWTKIQIPEMLLQADYIFTKRQNLRFTGEEEKWASLVNMTLRLELSASHVAILTGNSPLTTSYFEPTDFKLQCSSELQDNSYINFLHLAQNYLFYCVLP